MKKILFLLTSYFSVFIVNASLREDMLPSNNTVGVTWEWVWALTQVAVYTKNFLFSIVWVITIWVFLYFWFRLIIARWNEEEFKKALMWFLYAVIWLAIIPIAWWAVKLIATLKF